MLSAGLRSISRQRHAVSSKLGYNDAGDEESRRCGAVGSTGDNLVYQPGSDIWTAQELDSTSKTWFHEHLEEVRRDLNRRPPRDE